MNCNLIKGLNNSFIRRNAVFIIYFIILVIGAIFPFFGEMNVIKMKAIVEFRLDYFLHFIAYTGFYLLFIIKKYKFHIQFSKMYQRKFIAFTILLACGTELLQLFIKSRTFNPFDLIANLSGILAGLTIYWMVKHIKRSENTENKKY